MTTLILIGAEQVVMNASALCLIEEEIMPVTQLRDDLRQQRWKFSDIVAVAHILLQSAGHAPDYMCLAEQMLRQGTARLRADLEAALAPIVE